MIGYRLKYGEYGHDCWGKPEWCGWYGYDDNIYTSIDKVNEAKRIAEQKYHDREFKIFEVNID